MLVDPCCMVDVGKLSTALMERIESFGLVGRIARGERLLVS